MNHAMILSCLTDVFTFAGPAIRRLETYQVNLT
jgi:hypothetical protein